MSKINSSLKLVNNPRFLDYLNGNWIPPINIEISPSGVCDAACDHCFYKNEQSGKMIYTPLMKSALEQMKEIGVQSITWTGGGEPTLHKHFKEFSELAYDLGLKQGLITNALKKINYNPAVFDWVRVSKTNKPLNLENLSTLKSAKSVGLCVNYYGNEEELKEVISHSDKVDYIQVRPALAIHGNKTEIKFPEKYRGDKIIVSGNKFNDCSKGMEYKICEGYHFLPFIWENGNVNVCGYQKDYVLGDLNKENLKDILYKAPKSVKVLDNCQICCRLNEINKTINSSRELEDILFI